MNTSNSTQYSVIEKESIGQLTFPEREVITDGVKREERNNRVLKAMKLGNTKKIKVKIHFEDDAEIHRVETTVWGVTEKNILLKQDIMIPIKRIHEIKFF